MSLQCFNIGCGKKYDEGDNSDKSCVYHPGAPYFHDAMKFWSCCNKKSHDFQEFLEIKGCRVGRHSNIKPEPQAKPSEVMAENEKAKTTPYGGERIITQPERFSKKREVGDCEFVPIEINALPSLSRALSKLSCDGNAGSNGVNVATESVVKSGTPCYNPTCSKSYRDEASLSELCVYHSGTAVFHEGFHDLVMAKLLPGMKFWSCCEIKTTEFDTFMNQEGCTTGRHLWQKPKSAIEQSNTCRFDFSQTPTTVTIAVYAKLTLVDKSSIQVSSDTLKIDLFYENGKNRFTKEWPLFATIHADKTIVKAGVKVEIVLTKDEPVLWSRLEFSPRQEAEVNGCGEQPEVEDELEL